jgi:hypothetical protein
MITKNTAELLEKLRKGNLDQINTAWLDQVLGDSLVDQVRPSPFRLTFQERRIGKKWEIALARSFRAELTFRSIPDAVFVSVLLVPAYLNCLMLNIEDNRLTGISRLTRLTVWPVSEPGGGLALKSGRGFKLDKTPDGWAIKPMQRRLVKLSGDFLRERGWRFDHLRQFIPIP